MRWTGKTEREKEEGQGEGFTLENRVKRAAV